MLKKHRKSPEKRRLVAGTTARPAGEALDDKIGMAAHWPASAGAYTPFTAAQLNLLQRFSTAEPVFVDIEACPVPEAAEGEPK
jgi:hypothetical protein